MSIKLVDIPSIAKYTFYASSIMTLGDLISYSSKEILNLRNIGEKTLEEINKTLSSYNLSLRPYYLSKEDWQRELRDRFDGSKKEEKSNKSLHENNIYDDREYCKRVYNTLNEDLQYIYKIPVEFIVRHRETLRIIILQNKKIEYHTKILKGDFIAL